MNLKQTLRKSANHIYWYLKERIYEENAVNFLGKGAINFIDIGSIGGLPFSWSKNVHKIHHILKFEPGDTIRQNSTITVFDCALWNSDSEQTLYIYKGRDNGNDSASLFEQNYQYVRDHWTQLSKRGSSYLAQSWFERSTLVGTKGIFCRSLDSILSEKNIKLPFQFIKIDAQGAEYDILQGGKNTILQSCVGLQLELFTIPLFKGIKLLPEVKVELENWGFELVKQCPPHGSFDSQHDCIFLRREYKKDIEDLILAVYNEQ